MVDASTKRRNIQSLLDKWTEECGFNRGNVTFRGWTDLDHDGKWILGNCTYVYRNLCAIKLSDTFKERRFGFLEKSVLWHEMAHAITYLEDGISNDHDMHWRRTLWKKPCYAIGDGLAKVWFCFAHRRS